MLLDLSAAFDMIDNSVLCSFETAAGLKGTTLHLLRSYLTNRTSSVVIENDCSSVAHFNCRDPQGSFLLFSIYMLPVSQIIQNHNVSHHHYVDYFDVPLQSSISSSLDYLLACQSENFVKTTIKLRS